jgi:hypothetical protein
MTTRLTSDHKINFVFSTPRKKEIKQNKRKTTTLMIYLIGAVYVIAITLLIQDGLRKSRRARTPIITGR